MNEPNYQKGNYLAKAWFYINKGLDQVNNFKYLIAGILAFYYVLKIDNYLLLTFLFVVSVPILLVIGWIYVHKWSKILDWLSIEYSTYWGRYSFSLQEKIVELLGEIKDKLNKN